MAGSLMLLANLLFSAMAVAEQKETLGKWDVHYIAFNSTFTVSYTHLTLPTSDLV